MMRKIEYGIITHYDVHNHGAFLQLNGLSKVLKQEFNIEARALRFEKNYDYAEAGVKDKLKISFKSIGIYLKYIKDRGLRVFLFNIRKKILFSTFLKNEDLIGCRCDHSEKLDGIIIGSDEVFALHTGLTPEFFGYNLPSNKVFVYAGSFGPTTIADIRRLGCANYIRNGLKSMRGLSMRDENSVYITKELTGMKPALVVDPVILYGYKKELFSLLKPNLPKYLLVYAYESRLNTPDEYQPILRYAHKNDMIVVCAGFFHAWADKNINVDPVELLRYFKYANCAVTDTFHGCVLSLICGREMAVKLRDNVNKLYNLMREYSIEDRVINDDWKLDDIFEKKVNWEVVNGQIAERRAMSMMYLKKMIRNEA